MELPSTGVTLLPPLITTFWSSLAFDSFARRAEMACCDALQRSAVSRGLIARLPSTIGGLIMSRRYDSVECLMPRYALINMSIVPLIVCHCNSSRGMVWSAVMTTMQTAHPRDLVDLDAVGRYNVRFVLDQLLANAAGCDFTATRRPKQQPVT